MFTDIKLSKPIETIGSTICRICGSNMDLFIKSETTISLDPNFGGLPVDIIEVEEDPILRCANCGNTAHFKLNNQNNTYTIIDRIDDHNNKNIEEIPVYDKIPTEDNPFVIK